MDLHQRPRQFSGQLYKYTNVMKGWQYRYFTVDGSAGLLHYYLCEGEKPEGTGVPRGSVHLAGAVICPSDEDSKTFTVNCASGDMLKLRATDARARQEWVNGLRAVAESHTKAISATNPPLAPREHLAALDAMGDAKHQIQSTEQADIALCRILESAENICINDPNLLLLKATSAASLHCLWQCFNILQRNQHQQARTGDIRRLNQKLVRRSWVLHKKYYRSQNNPISQFSLKKYKKSVSNAYQKKILYSA